MKAWIGITWVISNVHGWGVYGLNLVRELHRRGSPTPILFDQVRTEVMDPEDRELLRPYIKFRDENVRPVHFEGRVSVLKDCAMLHALGNNLTWTVASEVFEGDVNLGVIFFENTAIGPEALARGAKLDGIIAGSTWNRDVLRARGLSRVEAVFQGIDTAIFKPLPRKGRFGDRFVVFSGGKLDYRKGQDIVLEAFKIFHRRHPEALLLTAWHNLWPHTALPIVNSPLIKALPRVDAKGELLIAEWAAQHDIPPGNFQDLGLVPNASMPRLLAEVDVAVFPNRCEGGTNLVAMEAMACGVPCVVSRNTGHLDLIGDDTCFVLEHQDPLPNRRGSTEGWGESSVEEVVALMEKAMNDREEAKRRGGNAARFMEDWSWSNQISRLLETIDALTPEDKKTPPSE